MNFMVDIETLGTQSTSIILSVGVVPFTHEVVLRDQATEFLLNIDEQFKRGRTLSASTLSWWMGQTDTVRMPIFNVPRDRTIDETISDINYYFFHQCEKHYNDENFNDRSAIKVWSNGPTFDLKILENLYEQMGRNLPYHYRSPRCQRTIEALHGKDVIKAPADDTQLHNAKYDAIFQAERIVDICKAKGLVI